MDSPSSYRCRLSGVYQYHYGTRKTTLTDHVFQNDSCSFIEPNNSLEAMLHFDFSLETIASALLLIVAFVLHPRLNSLAFLVVGLAVKKLH